MLIREAFIRKCARAGFPHKLDSKIVPYIQNIMTKKKGTTHENSEYQPTISA